MKKNSKPSTLSMSICLPVYKGSHVLPQALTSILRQKFSHYEIIIGDDNRAEDETESIKTKQIIASMHDKRIKYFKNHHNLGYPANLKKIVSRAKHDIIFLMAQDDILSTHALQKTHDAFIISPDIGVVTRPYFWYMDDIKHPVRVVAPYNTKVDSILSVFDGEKEFVKIFESVGQLSGLAYRRKYLTTPFNLEVFPAHIYPFAGILKKYKCVFLHDYTVAVGIKDSQTRSKSSIYDLSPTQSWLKMYRSVFAGQKFAQQRSWGLKHMATHFEGLVQIKNYAGFDTLIKEIIVLLKNRPQNMINPRFWFYVAVTTMTPRFFLARFTDWYKDRILARQIPQIKFTHF